MPSGQKVVGGGKGLSGWGYVCGISAPHPASGAGTWQGAAHSSAVPSPSPLGRQDLVARLDSALCGTSGRLLSLSGPVFLLHNEDDDSYLERLTEVVCLRHLALSMCSPNPRP